MADTRKWAYENVDDALLDPPTDDRYRLYDVVTDSDIPKGTVIAAYARNPVEARGRASALLGLVATPHAKAAGVSEIKSTFKTLDEAERKELLAQLQAMPSPEPAAEAEAEAPAAEPPTAEQPATEEPKTRRRGSHGVAPVV